ncbi:MAG: hypothetical protein PHC64_07180 [Candidatus Gastranaerophilales bacterium]|nr:hypothetical protein [Candidatus Gastranaerophilales bacterium]
MDFSSTSTGGVKVILYTGKPYKDSVVVNKKSDSEYVILMPETSNSMTSAPILNSVIGTVKGVNVKTQQYENQIKGYTKITVSTLKPVEVVPQVQTLNTSAYNLSENDYNELLAQTAKKETKTVKPTEKPVIKTKTVTIQPKTAVVKPKVKPVIAIQKTVKTMPIKTNVQKPIVKQAEQKSAETKTVKPTVTVPTPTPTPTVSPEPVMPPPQQVQPAQPIVMPPIAEPVSMPENVGWFKKFENILRANFYAVLLFLLGSFVILLLVVRKINSNHSRQKEIFKANLDEKPLSTTDYAEKISEDMTWKEKFQTYVDAQQPQPEQTDINKQEVVEDNQELDDLFSEEIPYIQPVEKVEQDISLYELPQEELPDFTDIDELFGEENEEETGVIESSEIIKSEFAIDEDKGFYLVDFEDSTALVGHIDEEIFVLKRFDNKVEGILQARLDEKTAQSSNYMTKVGNFKALVKVTPNDMNLLIEL